MWMQHLSILMVLQAPEHDTAMTARRFSTVLLILSSIPSSVIKYNCLWKQMYIRTVFRSNDYVRMYVSTSVTDVFKSTYNYVRVCTSVPI